MAVRTINGSWWVDFRANHQRYRIKSPKNTRAGALAYEATLRQNLARTGSIKEPEQAPRQDQTFEQFAWRWFDEYVKSNNKYSEQLSKKYALSSSLIPFFGRMPIGQIKSHDIERYKAQQLQKGFKNKTIANRLTILNKCLVTAYEWLELEGAPPKIKWLRWTPPEIDYLSPDECELLLSHADGVIFEMVLMALRTGMRQGELRALQWSSIDWLTRSVAVRHSRDDHQRLLVPPKNGRTRHIPLDTDVYALLYARKRNTGYVFLAPDGQPFTSDRLHDAMQRLCREAKFRRIGWHTLRHTFASHLAMRGVPLPAVKELLGHAAITTTMRYAHVAPSTLRSAIEMLNPKTLVGTDFGQPVGNQWQEMQRNEASEKIQAPKYA
jgi:integrase